MPLTGPWVSEDSRSSSAPAPASWRRSSGATPDLEPVVFEPDGLDAFRTVSGRERGERLLVHRRDDGSIRMLSWATYRCTREPLGFGERNG